MRTIAYACSALLAVVTLLCLAPSPALAVFGTAGDCSMGCAPGDNSCMDCCSKLFPVCKRPCMDAYNACQTNCGLGPQMSCRKNCEARLEACNQGCTNLRKDITCSGWVDPHTKCPYDCQMWNPASRTCIGPHMNGCSH